MSYHGLSTTVIQLIIVLFWFPHSKSRRVQKSTVCMHCMLSMHMMTYTLLFMAPGTSM